MNELKKIWNKPKVKVFYMEINADFSKQILQTTFQKLPIIFQEKLNAYTDAQEKNVRIAGKYLVEKIIEDLNIAKKPSLQDLRLLANGQAIFSTKKDIHFSIAHSKNKVVCAVALHKKIGIDIEHLQAINEVLLTDYLCQEEIFFVENSKDKNSTFLHLWTKKEALAKATGMGILQDFSSINVIENSLIFENIHYQFSTLAIVENCICNFVVEN